MKDENLEFIEALTASQEALRGYCYSKLRCWADGDDVLQATNVKLWEKAADWDRDRPFLPWAFGVARYTVLSHFRDKGRDRLVFDEDVMKLMEPHLQQSAAETPKQLAILRLCMEKMEDGQREMLRSHYVAGWSLAELSEASGRSVSGLKSLLMRLRKILTECVTREESKEERGGYGSI